MTAKREPSLEKSALVQDELPCEQAERHFQETESSVSKGHDHKHLNDNIPKSNQGNLSMSTVGNVNLN